ncbi:hypothetical protein ACFVY1_38900 [Streptomyces sp. NPDC058293]|uniref:hypothetical protein n=1 Tax=Streptomyces sp. NPDC058293 TaxID=3346429 RepID=UPI0036EACD6E
MTIQEDHPMTLDAELRAFYEARQQQIPDGIREITRGRDSNWPTPARPTMP